MLLRWVTGFGGNRIRSRRLHHRLGLLHRQLRQRLRHRRRHRKVRWTESQPEFTRISPQGAPVSAGLTDTAQRVEEISELPDSVRNNLPAMTFSFHVYSIIPNSARSLSIIGACAKAMKSAPVLQLQEITDGWSDSAVLSSIAFTSACYPDW